MQLQLFTSEIEVEAFIDGHYHSGKAQVQWSFDVTFGKQEVFSMGITLVDQTIKCVLNDYNEETDEESTFDYEIQVDSKNLSQIKYKYEIEDFANGMKLCNLEINDNSQKIVAISK